MNKRKKAPQNIMVYWWNEFLFARYFEYETDLSPEEIAENLESIAHKRQGWIWGLEKTSKTTLHPNQKGLDFDVQSRRRRMFDPIGMTTARTLGTAKVDSGTGRTLVRGDVKLGRFIHVFLLLYVIFFFAVEIPLIIRELTAFGTSIGVIFGVSIPFLIIGLIFGALWYRLYQDRNNLADLIEDAMFDEKAKRAEGRLVDDAINDGWVGENEATGRKINKRL